MTQFPSAGHMSFQDHAGAQDYIRSLLPHVQADYCHPSLGSKVKIQVEGNPRYFGDLVLRPSTEDIYSMRETTRLNLGSADLMVYLVNQCDHLPDCYHGIAFRSTVCRSSYDSRKQSINTIHNTAHHGSRLLTARIIAHEMGHNFGMWHDDNDRHKGKGCENSGIMSSVANKWSTCSQADFHAHYLKYKYDWCLERKFLNAIIISNKLQPWYSSNF